MDQPRRLVLVRHAQATDVAPSDIERPLTDEGRADAAALGRWLAEYQVSPDEAWVSAAVRTRETWTALSAAAGWSLEPHHDGLLYGTDEVGVLELVHAAGPEVRTLLVLGHNPTMEMVVHLLDDGDGTTGDGLPFVGFPTATAAVLELAVPWAEAGPMTGRLTAVHVARAEG